VGIDIGACEDRRDAAIDDAGTLSQTGNDLDLAITGEGFSRS